MKMKKSTTIYEKPVWKLMHDFAKDEKIVPGKTFTKEQVVSWFKKHYPLIKVSNVSANLIMMSTNAPSRVHYNVRADGGSDLFFQTGPSQFRLYDPATDPPPIQKGSISPGPDGPEVDGGGETEGREFAYEHDLRDFLARNLTLVEPGLKLYEEEGIRGIEFPASRRFIDILAVDRRDNYVVIELKVSRGYDRVIGQLLWYMAWVERNHAEHGKQVRGMIIARAITEDLLLATSRIANVELFEYELSVSLKRKR
jgi:endonuclease